MKFNISTRSIGDGRIEQTITTDAYDQHRQVYTMVMDTREQQTRQALIDLGWTPPITKEEVQKLPLPNGTECQMTRGSFIFTGAFSMQDFMRLAAYFSSANYASQALGAPYAPSNELVCNTKNTSMRVLDRAIIELSVENEKLSADGRASKRIDKVVAALKNIQMAVESGSLDYNDYEYKFINERHVAEHYELDVSGNVTFHRKALSEWPEWARDFYNKHQAPRRVSLADINLAHTDVFYPEVYRRDADGLVTHVITPVSKWPVWTSEVSIRSNV